MANLVKEKIRTFNSIGRSGVVFFRGQLRKKKKIATGKTVNSIIFTTRYDLFTFSLEWYADKSWFYILRGRKPGGKFPPKEAILEWMKARNIKPKSIGGRKPISEESLLFLIRRKIARDGIPKTDLYEGVQQFFKNQVETRGKDAVREDLRETVFQEMSKHADATR